LKPKVYITRSIPKSIVNKIKDKCDVSIWDKEDVPVPRNVLEREIDDIDGLLCMLTESIDKELLEKANKLKVISNMAVGFNNIDVGTASEKNIVVTNTPGVLTETTADLTFGLLIATARRMVEATDYLKQGNWTTWSPMMMTGQDVYGATIGIIGFGRIGKALAKRARGFGMDILYYNRSRKKEDEEYLGATYVELKTLLQQSDFVCVQIPYSSETENLIAENEFKLMKSSAVIINTARGGIVNEADLYNALTKKEIWGAGLDVFKEEPIKTNDTLLELPNVISLPHIGSASIQTRKQMANLAADNLINVSNGETAITPVN